MTSALRLYGMIVVKETQRFFTYRVNIFASCLTGIFMLVARYALWAALFATGNAQDATLSETMTFFVVTDVLMIWMASYYGDTIGADIKSGDIAQRLIRPFPYHLQLVAGFHAGALCNTVTRALPMLLAAIFFVGIMPPVSVVAFGFFLVSLVLGGIIYALIDLIISYTAFWLTEYWYLSWFKSALFMLFGGVMLPIWFYPSWLQALCLVLPFQYSIFAPISIYLGRIPVSNFGIILVMQVLWIALLYACERALWRMAQHKIVVQGG